MIRDDPALCGTKVIIVSAIAHGAADLREDIRREVDADDYIVKPYDPARLLQRVTEILGS
jgi:DNA-binding response OmpR family regulator